MMQKEIIWKDISLLHHKDKQARRREINSGKLLELPVFVKPSRNPRFLVIISLQKVL